MTIGSFSALNIGQVTHQQYVTALSEWMSSMWANGGQSRQQVLSLMSPAWYSAKYGEPDATDQDGDWSPRTILAFSRFASDYRPGASPGLDQVMPYVPPTGNEFIESPEQTATRIASAQFERDLDARIAMNAADIQARAAEGAAQRSFLAGENAADRQLSAAETNARIQAEMEGIKAQIKQSAMSAFNQAFSNEISKFGVEAGMYNTQQGIQSANLQTAGSLSSVYQQLLDERTNKAITAQTEPGRFLEREAQVRAMQAPQGTDTPAYSNFDRLLEVIDKLINTQGGVKPTAPDASTYQVPPQLQALMDYTPTAPAPVTAPGSGYSGGGSSGTSVDAAIKAMLAAGYGDASQRSGMTTTQPSTQPTGSQAGVPAIYGYDPNTPKQPKGALAMYAYGVRNKRAAEFITGDPQRDGKPNPEMVRIHNPGPKTKVDVVPMKSMSPIQRAAMMRSRKKMAYGSDLFDPNTLTLRSYPDEAYQNYSSLAYLQGKLPKSKYNTLATGTASGYAGGQYPESGSINYGKYLDIAKDPVSLAMLSSGYKSASRDLFAEVARAKARAPLGQAVQTSLIRT